MEEVGSSAAVPAFANEISGTGFARGGNRMDEIGPSAAVPASNDEGKQGWRP